MSKATAIRFKMITIVSVFQKCLVCHVYHIIFLIIVLKSCCSAVVYLDADTIVVKSIEDVFKCGKFCGNLKHSERMNSGVMVVEPSETLFKDMISQVDRLPSYTGGQCTSFPIL